MEKSLGQKLDLKHNEMDKAVRVICKSLCELNIEYNGQWEPSSLTTAIDDENLNSCVCQRKPQLNGQLPTLIASKCWVGLGSSISG